MVNRRSILDGPMRAFNRLVRMALQPQRPCQEGTSPNITIETEIDRISAPRAWCSLKRRFKLDASAGKIPHVSQRNPRNATRERCRGWIGIDLREGRGAR